VEKMLIISAISFRETKKDKESSSYYEMLLFIAKNLQIFFKNNLSFIIGIKAGNRKENTMSEKPRVAGCTTIAPEVIETIIKMTACETKGVNRVFVSPSNSGVKIKIEENIVHADVYVILDHRQNTLKVGKKLQNDISRAISETVGMEPGCINIHVEDFDFPTTETVK